MKPKAKIWDTTEPADAWSEVWTCNDPSTGKQMQMARSDCYKGAVLAIQDNELKDVPIKEQEDGSILAKIDLPEEIEGEEETETSATGE